MTLDLERRAIEAFFIAQWADATPVGLDAHEFTPVENSVRLTIQSGAVLQGSVGRASDRLDNMGLVQVQIYTAGGLGSTGWRGYAETIQSIFRNKTIDQSGAVITAHADAFVRFSPQDQHPFVSSDFPSPPFHQTTINAPFVRYSYS